MLDAILENDHKLTASERGRLWSTTMFHIWAGVGGAWSTTIIVLGVKNSTFYLRRTMHKKAIAILAILCKFNDVNF